MREADEAVDHLIRNLPRRAGDAAKRAASCSSFTPLLTHEVARELLAVGGRVYREYESGATRSLRSGRELIGFLDLFAVFSDMSSLAIEIDRANKTWSLAKLEHMAAKHGSRMLWIRWRGKIQLPAGCEVPVLDLSTIGERVPPAARSSNGQRALRLDDNI